MYIPKNKIVTNLYTRGNEYQYKKDGISYEGYYWTMYNGKIFTGKNPNDKPTEELVDVNKITDNIWNATVEDKVFQQYTEIWDGEVVPGKYQDVEGVILYNNITNTDVSVTKLIPQQYYPTPTNEDYEIGAFTRFFACKINEPQYIELSQETYDKMVKQDPTLLWEMYKVFKIQWTLVGQMREVYDTNEAIIKLKEKKLNKKGFTQFLKNNFNQFFKPINIQTDLYTDGTEFYNRSTGEAYIGSYHIHPDLGPMVGAKHIAPPHDYLDPLP